MFDPEAPSSKRVLALLNDERMRERLHQMAKWSTHNDADAEDLVADSIPYLLDPEKDPWVPEKCSFLTHAGRRMRKVWNQQMRTARVRHEVVDENVAFDIGTLSKEPPADEELDRRRSLAIRRKLADRVRALLAPGSIARRCLELGVQGVESCEEKAEKIPCEVAQVYDAHEQLGYHAEKVLAEWNAEEEERMRALRATARGSSRKEVPDDAP